MPSDIAGSFILLWVWPLILSWFGAFPFILLWGPLILSWFGASLALGTSHFVLQPVQRE